MADNYLSGVTGAVYLGGVSPEIPFQKWGLSIKTGLPKVNNFTSAFQLLVAGITSGTITADGPYNQGNMPIASGKEYSFQLDWYPGIHIMVSAFVESLDLDNDVEGAPRVRITAQSTGAFTLSIA